jgi:hypothetical protein
MDKKGSNQSRVNTSQLSNKQSHDGLVTCNPRPQTTSGHVQHGLTLRCICDLTFDGQLSTNGETGASCMPRVSFPKYTKRIVDL